MATVVRILITNHMGISLVEAVSSFSLEIGSSTCPLSMSFSSDTDIDGVISRPLEKVLGFILVAYACLIEIESQRIGWERLKDIFPLFQKAGGQSPFKIIQD